jgi:hypothetical protein
MIFVIERQERRDGRQPQKARYMGKYVPCPAAPSGWVCGLLRWAPREGIIVWIGGLVLHQGVLRPSVVSTVGRRKG